MRLPCDGTGLTQQTLGASDKDNISAGLVDRSAGGPDAFHGKGLVVESERRSELTILKGETGHTGLDGKADIGRNPFRIRSEAGLEIRIHWKIDCVTERSQVLQNVGASYCVVWTAHCPRVAGTGRSQGDKAEVLQHPRAAYIPGVWQDKAALLVEGPESGALFDNGAGHCNLNPE